MKVTEIEVHRITLPYMDWISYQLNHYYGPISRTIYVAHTDDGLVGLGESHNTEPREAIDGYIGTNPFDHLGDEVSLGLGTAMYDLMGKAAGVPVYKLIGQKYRSWVPVGSWTVSTHPERMAEAVREYSARGDRRAGVHGGGRTVGPASERVLLSGQRAGLGGGNGRPATPGVGERRVHRAGDDGHCQRARPPLPHRSTRPATVWDRGRDRLQLR